MINNEFARAVQSLELDGIEDFDQYWPYVKGANAFDAYKSGDWNKARYPWDNLAVLLTPCNQWNKFTTL